MSDEVERTLCQLPYVHVFRIPVRSSADGHRAADWPKEPAWTGKLKILAKGRNLAIVLYDETKTFAVCHANDDSAIERCLDSGRYFVLRISNDQGRKAYIGIAFNERNDAFDFNVSINEFKQELEREDKAAHMGDVPVEPMRDLSLKDGEKIKIKINLKKKNADGEVEGEGDNVETSAPRIRAPPKIGVTGGGLLPPPKGGLLPPPGQGPIRAPSGHNLTNKPAPSATGTVAANTAQTNSASSTAFATSDPFGDDPFSSSANSSTSTAANDTVFGFAGGSDPFAATPSNFTGSSTVSDPPAKPAKPVKPTASSGEANLLDL